MKGKKSKIVIKIGNLKNKIKISVLRATKDLSIISR